MAGKVNSVDDFLNHRGSTGGKSTYFKWKEDGAGTALVWLHTGVVPQPIWIHPFYKVVLRENEKSRKQETRVWMDRLVCHEDEDVLKEYKRDRDGDIQNQLTHCPMCRLAAFVRRNVKSGRLKLTTPLFRFKSDIEKECKTVHAGGFAGLFTDDLTDEQKDELKEAGVSLRFAFGENALAKLNYLFLVVAENDVAAGVQVAFETELLGDKIKKVIHDARRSDGSEAGDPFKHPYAFEWEANGKARKINEKYDARQMRSTKLTPAVKKLITGPAPSTKHLTKPFDVDTLRAFLERHCLIKGVPWDDIFKVESRDAPDEDADSDVDFPPPDESGTIASEGSTPSVNTTAAPASVEDELYECECCGKGSPDPAVCTHCGAKYAEDGALTFDPRKKEEPKLRKRGAAPAEAKKDVTPKDFKPNDPGEAGDESDVLPWG